MEYALHLCILICIYTILGQSLSLVAGYSGQVSLAHAGFYGIGAYTTALLSVDYGFSVFVNFPIALFISGFIAFVVSKVAVRAVDDYYIIITLGIQVVIYSIMNNWQDVTRGPLGIPGIPTISIFEYSLDSKLSYLSFTVIVTGTIWYVLHNITFSPFGRVLQALSEDEIFSKSLGKNVSQAKVISFTISGMLASVAGILFAHYISFIDPSSFTIEESIFILSITIIGGMRNLTGIFLAATFLVLLPEFLRFVGIPGNIAANVRQIFYGAALIVVVYKHGLKKKNSESPPKIIT